MTWKIAFFTSILALAASLFWGFNRTIVESEIDCTKCLCSSNPNLKIPVDSAVVDMNLFRQFRDSLDISSSLDTVKEGGDQVLVNPLIEKLSNLRGFELAHHELSAMLHDAGCDAQVWAMLSVRPIPDEPRNPSDWNIDLIFQVRKPVSGGEQLREADDFFDFTNPCPDSCPE